MVGVACLQNNKISMCCTELWFKDYWDITYLVSSLNNYTDDVLLWTF